MKIDDQDIAVVLGSILMFAAIFNHYELCSTGAFFGFIFGVGLRYCNRNKEIR